MTLHLITIVLDGMPFISWHYPILRQLKLDWHWWVVEGVALPEKDTCWCAKLEPRVSRDGTHRYLCELTGFDKRVTHFYQPAWPGKTSMFNTALAEIEDPEFVLMQVDSDEIWTTGQIERVFWALANRDELPGNKILGLNCAFFRCRYFAGPDLVITSRGGFGNYDAYEWKRAWRVPRGALFETHEPPKLAGFVERPWTQAETEAAGLVFDHFAYATEAQMRFKEGYYNSPRNPNGSLYHGAAAAWRRLQSAPMPVASLKDFFPWVGEGVTVDRI